MEERTRGQALVVQVEVQKTGVGGVWGGGAQSVQEQSAPVQERAVSVELENHLRFSLDSQSKY